MKTIVETVYDSDLQLVDHPENLLEFAEWLKEQMEKIPAEYSENATFRWENPHPDEGVRFIIQYTRPETKEEESENKRLSLIRAFKKENHDKVELARLKKLYPDH